MQPTNQNLSPLSTTKHLFFFVVVSTTTTTTKPPTQTSSLPSKMPSTCKTPRPKPHLTLFHSATALAIVEKPKTSFPKSAPAHIKKTFQPWALYSPLLFEVHVCMYVEKSFAAVMQCRLCGSNPSIHLSINLNSRGAFVVTNHRCR